MTHICVIKVTIIGSDNGLSPDRRQAIIWTNAGKWSIGPLGSNFDEILIEIHTFSFKKIHLKMASGKWCPFCLGLNVLSKTVETLILKKRHSIFHLWGWYMKWLLWVQNFVCIQCMSLSYYAIINQVVRRFNCISWLGAKQAINHYLNQYWFRLTHWGRDKMAAIFQTTSSYAFSLMKMNDTR